MPQFRRGDPHNQALEYALTWHILIYKHSNNSLVNYCEYPIIAVEIRPRELTCVSHTAVSGYEQILSTL